MFSLLTGKHARDNDCNVEGFGDTWTSDEVYYGAYNPTAGANKVKDNLRSGITNSSYKTVSFKPLFGILNQPKFIPLQWLPLTMEFELVTDALDPIIPSDANSQFTVATTSTSWEIKNCFIKADVIELDSAVHNEYASHLMNGNPIPINYSSFITQVQAVGGSDIAGKYNTKRFTTQNCILIHLTVLIQLQMQKRTHGKLYVKIGIRFSTP
jgi:hypothetical protein